MATESCRNEATTPRRRGGRPFASSNSGRPRGARNKTTVACEALLDAEAKAVTAKAIKLAKGGDTVALRLVMDRIIPPRLERPISITLPPIQTMSDLPGVLIRIFEALAIGQILPGDASTLVSALSAIRQAYETCELAERLTAVEARIGEFPSHAE